MGQYPFSLAIAAIFRNEAPYLREWIEFHLEMRCEHFYLFNNLSGDHYAQVLQPYIDRGLVELIPWPLEHSSVEDWGINQCLAYEKAIRMATGKAKWLAILDTDEFLFPVKDDHLVQTLSRYGDCGGLAVNWQVFGTSSVSKIPEDRLLIEMLQYKLPATDPTNLLVKSIVQPQRVQGCASSHCVLYKPGYFQVNTDRLAFEGKCAPYVQIDALRINHYQVRDEHYLHTQKIPRVRKWWNLHTPEAWEAKYRGYNQVQDQAIFRFLPRLKSRF